jgi:hypothetical protein
MGKARTAIEQLYQSKITRSGTRGVKLSQNSAAATREAYPRPSVDLTSLSSFFAEHIEI